MLFKSLGPIRIPDSDRQPGLQLHRWGGGRPGHCAEARCELRESSGSLGFGVPGPAATETEWHDEGFAMLVHIHLSPGVLKHAPKLFAVLSRRSPKKLLGTRSPEVCQVPIVF